MEQRPTMTAALGFLAAALSISVVWPQVWRSCRHGRTRGLSPTGAWLGVGLNLCWLTFGILIGDPAQIATNVVVGAANTAVLVSVLVTQPHLRSGRMLLRTATGALALAALAAGSMLAVILHGAQPAAVGATLGSIISLVGAAAALSQPLNLLTDRDQDLSGLSPARWRLGAGSCASWVTYGWVIDQPNIWLSGGFGLCCAVVVCSVLHARRTPAAIRTAATRAAAPWAGRFACPAQARAVVAAV
jgi:uncharacterized protein with PQ loop repeat